MHLVALLVFYLDMLETMYTMLVLLGLANVLNIRGRRRAGISYASESMSRFKNCLGALDGTYIKVHVPVDDIPRWEGSAADGRVLKDVITKRNGLKVP
ncbi:hypothetical protein Pint_13695 [Pistacia integerrima]|uniref:Uncharacterized protein n=1 Tax=Pistacia integerrima TaxID=434235 RepID=A0ACC0Y9D4_9ROSI|nr:hypothetical protein Pint_13695 [Pistacia integerrima]